MRRLCPLLLVLLAGTGLTACGDQASSSSGGDVVVGHVSDKVSGDSAYVLLPTGRIDLTVGEPVDGVSADQAGDGEKHAAPDGGAFVPVTWEHDPFGAGAVQVGVVGAQPQQADVTLVAGGTTADLGSPYDVVADTGTTDSGVGTMYVAVGSADDARDVRFEVSYDGLTQTVDPATGERDSGAAAPLYDEPTMGIEAPCTSEGFATGGLRPSVACVVNPPQRTPYLPGHRWAEDGHTWLLVSVDITLDGVEAGPTSYDVQAVTPQLAVNGVAPLPATELYGSAEPLPTAVRGTWAFDGRAGGANTLTVGLDLVLRKTSGPGLSTRRVTVEQSVELGAG